MQCLVLAGILAAIGVAIYRNGKRTGSRQGYWVGRHRRR
jgi:hypothetical protein